MKFRILFWLGCVTIIVAVPFQKSDDTEVEIPELAYINKSLDPCDDFYEYTCGNFNNIQPIPEGQPIWDHFLITQSNIEKQTRDILEAPRRYGEPQGVRKAKDMYASCLNTHFLDLFGLYPLTNVLNKWGGWPLISNTWAPQTDNLWEQIADIHYAYGIPILFDLTVRSYMYNSSEMVIYVDRDTFALPTQIQGLPIQVLDDYIDSSLQRSDSPYITYMIQVATELRDHLGQFAATDEKIREELLEVNEFMVILRDAQESSSNNPIEAITVKELQEWTDDNIGDYPTEKLDWLTYLQHVFRESGPITENTKVYLNRPEKTYTLIKLFGSSSKRLIANFLFTRLMTYLSPETNKYMRDLAMDFYVQIDYMAPNQPRWKYCLRKVLDYPYLGMSLAVSYEYQRYYVSQEKLNQAAVLVDDLRSSFNRLLDENLWMNHETRENARLKAEEMLILIGSSEVSTDRNKLDNHFKSLYICRYDHFGNINRLRVFTKHLNYASLNLPRNRTEWTQSSLVVNAFYNTLNNRLTFPLAIMNAPFYVGTPDSLLDYSRIGAIIGHELTHGFDSSGKNFDGQGTYSDWWTGNTSTSYSTRANCFREQYSSQIIPELNMPVNGNLTITENIADNGGIREAFYAYKQMEGFDDSQLTHGYTNDQLFFVGYGTLWCRTSTVKALYTYLLSDVHAPNRFRVNVPLSNMDEFSKAFNCPVGSNMNPEQKCIMW